MTTEATEIIVSVEVPPTPEPEVPPPSSVTGETVPAMLPELVSLAATVGSLEAKVQQLEAKALESEQATEAAQLTADVALTVAATAPTPEPEPEAEASAVTEVTVPSSAVVDGPAKTPATARPWWSRALLG